MIDNELENKR